MSETLSASGRFGRRVRLWWRRRVLDRLFELRDWLGDSTSSDSRRNRPHLDIEALEIRSLMSVASLASSTYSIAENAGLVTVAFNLNATAVHQVDINFSTANGTATAGSDYTAKTGTVSIPIGQSSGTTTIKITDDDVSESGQTFTVTIDSVSAGDTIGSPAFTTVTINNVTPSNWVATGQQRVSDPLHKTIFGIDGLGIDVQTGAGRADAWIDRGFDFPAIDPRSVEPFAPMIPSGNQSGWLASRSPANSALESMIRGGWNDRGFTLPSIGPATIDPGFSLPSTDPRLIDPGFDIGSGNRLPAPRLGNSFLDSFRDAGSYFPIQWNYDSSTLNVRPILETTFATDSGSAVPDTVDLRLTFNGAAQSWQEFTTTGHAAGDTYVLGAQVSSAVTTAGRYGWILELVAHFTGRGDVARTVTGNATVLPRGTSPFGPGWNLTGLDRLRAVTGGMVYEYGGSGSRFFADAGGGAYTRPANDFGALVHNGNGTYTYTTPQQWQFVFDSSGYIINRIDPHNLTATFVYDGSHLLQRIVSANGSTATFVYDGSSRVQVVQLPGPRLATITFDGNGDVQQIQYPDSNTRTFVYDSSSHRLTNDRWGNRRTTIAYDSATGAATTMNRGGISTGMFPDGEGVESGVSAAAARALQTTPVRNASDVLSPVVDAFDRTTTLSLDLWGRPTRVVYPDGNVRDWFRNSGGQITLFTNELNQVTTYTYAANTDDLTSVIRPDGATDQYVYDSTFHRLTRITDALGRVTTFTLTAQGDIETVVEPHRTTTYTWSNGQIQTVLDALNRTTSYIYSGRQLQAIRNALDERVTFTYDAAGNLQSIFDALGRRTTATYNGNRQVVDIHRPDLTHATYAYSPEGLLTSSTNPLGRTDYLYSNQGWQIGLIEAAGTVDERTTSMQYDVMGQLIGIRDPLNYRTTFTYDSRGRRTEIINALLETTTFAYDFAGRLTAITDALNNTTTFVYNSRGWQTELLNPLGQTTTAVYDAVGNLIRTIDAANVVNSYAYDTGNRLTRIDRAYGLPEVETTTGIYDAVGNLRSATDGRGATTSFAYDALNRVTRIIEGYGSPVQRTTTAAYDAGSRLLSATDPRGVTTSFAYDVRDHVVRLIEAFGDPLQRTTTMTFTSSGLLASTIYPLGATTSYAYDYLGRLTRETAAAGTSDQRTTTLVYDALHRVAVVDALNHRTTAVYDGARRLIESIDPALQRTTITYTGAGDVLSILEPNLFTTSFAYDGLRRIVRRIDAYNDDLERTTTFAYDTVGNLRSAISADGVTTSYAFDGRHQLTRLIDAHGNALVRTTTLAYDAVGELISSVDPRGSTTTFSYDLLRQPTDQINALGQHTRATFDANGNLTRLRTPRDLTATEPYVVSSGSAAVGWQFTMAAAMDADGNSVVVWTDCFWGSDYDAVVQRFNARGEAVGSPIKVDTSTTGYQYATSVAMNASGQFVVAWNFNSDAYVRVFNADGSARTGDIRAHAVTTNNQSVPVVAMDATGDFVVAWVDYRGGPASMYRRRFDVDGNALENETIVDLSHFGTSVNYEPAVAMDADGDFVIAQVSYGLAVDSLHGVYAQRFNSAGAAVGNPFHVNTYTTGYQKRPSVAMDADGDFVISWQGSGPSGAGYDVWARRYNAAGTALDATEFMVNQYTTGTQYDSRVSADVDGLFVFSWRSFGQIGASDKWDAYARRMEFDGTWLSGEIRVTNDTANQHDHYFATAAVGAGGDGDFIVTWSSYNGGNAWDAMARRYSPNDVTKFTYDNLNRAVRVDEAYNTLERRTTTLSYDAGDNLRSVTNARNITTSFAYDSLHRLTRIIEAYGLTEVRTTTLVYDLVGNLLSSKDPLNVQTTYSFDALDRITQVIEAVSLLEQRTTTFAYDNVGNLVGTTDPLGQRVTATFDKLRRPTAVVDILGQTTFVYDKVDRLLSSSDPRNVTTSFAYDALGRVTRTIEAFGDGMLQRTTTMAYDKNNNLTEVIAPLGRTTSYAYDALNRLTSSTNPLGDRTTLTYDGASRLLSLKNARDVVTSYAYDGLGQVTRVIEAFGNALQRTTTTAYDPVGNILTVTDPRNIVTSFAYDSFDNVARQIDAFGDSLVRTTTMSYDAGDNLLTITNPRGYTTSFSYDGLHRQTEVRDALNGVATTVYDLIDRVIANVDQLGHRTTIAYDAVNRRVTSTDALLNTTTFAYDTVGNLLAVTNARNHTTSFEYDAHSRNTAVIDALNQRTTMEYDLADRQTGLLNARGHRGTLSYDALDRLIAQTDALNHTVTSVFDANGNLTRSIDALGKTTTFTYDALDRVVTSQSATGGVRTAVYDAADNLLARIDPLNHRTTYAYDALSRQVTIRDARDGVTTLGYDKADNLVRVLDPVGNGTSYVYDALNRQVERIDPLLNSSTFAYDAASRLTGTTDRLGRRIDFDYDIVNRQTSQIWRAAGGSISERVTFVYDAVGNQTSAANHAGLYSMHYDNVERVDAVTNPFSKTLTFTYDAAGNRTKVQDSLGGVQTSVYDAANRLVTLMFDNGTAHLRSNYAYTVRNQIEQITRFSDLAGSTEVGRSNYEYDDAGRTTLVKHRDGASSWFQTTTYSYDAADRMTVQNSGTPITYTYDAADQLTADESTSTSYDLAGNRNSGGYSTTTGNRLSADGTWTYEYNDEGNLIKKTLVADDSYWTYAYDEANELTAASHFDYKDDLLAAASYTYDAWGNLIERTDGTVLRYAQDGWKTEQDFWGSSRNDLGTENFDTWADLDDSNALVARRVFGDGVDESTARVIGSAVAWYHRDVRGSVTALTNGSGTQLGAIAYDGFGKVTSDTTGGNDDRYTYAGRERDSLTGLQYNRARWYDPATARWQSEDPLGQAAGDVNLHRYAGNGPTNWTDPSGYAATAQNLDELPAGSGVVNDVYRIPRMTPGSFGPQPTGNWTLPSQWGQPGPSIQTMQQGGAPSREHFEAIVMAGAPGNEPTTVLTTRPDSGLAEQGGDLSGQIGAALAGVQAGMVGNGPPPGANPWHAIAWEGDTRGTVVHDVQRVERPRIGPPTLDDLTPRWNADERVNVQDVINRLETHGNIIAAMHGDQDALQTVIAQIMSGGPGTGMPSMIGDMIGRIERQEAAVAATAAAGDDSRESTTRVITVTTGPPSAQPAANQAPLHETGFFGFFSNISSENERRKRLDEQINKGNKARGMHEIKSQSVYSEIVQAAGEGLRDGTVIVGNRLTGGLIPSLRQESERLIATNGGLYAWADAAGSVAATALSLIPVCQVGAVAGVALRGFNAVQAAGSALDAGISLANGDYLGAGLSALGVAGHLTALSGACFAAGTPIRTPVGYKPIEQLRAGDLVLTRDERYADSAVVARPVLQTITNTSQILRLEVGEHSIRTSAEHPFYVKNFGWRPARLIQPGDELLTESGTWVDCRAAVLTAEFGSVYNVEVDECHTYFVGKPEWRFSVWAHNSCGPVNANRATSRRVNHGYAIFDQNSGKVYKFGVSSGRVNAAGESYRAVNQVNRLNAAGGNHTSLILGNFPNRLRALIWEAQTVGSFRALGHALIGNIRPAGIPFA